MLRALDKYYVLTVESLIIFGLSLMVVLTFASTMIRALGYGGIFWSEELTRYASIWVVMLGAGHGIRYGIHLSVDIFVEWMPAGAAKALRYFCQLLVVVFAAVLVIYGTRLSVTNIGQLSTSLKMSMAYVQVAIPVGGALMIYETLRAVVFELCGETDPTVSLSDSINSDQLEIE